MGKDPTGVLAAVSLTLVSLTLVSLTLAGVPDDVIATNCECQQRPGAVEDLHRHLAGSSSVA